MEARQWHQPVLLSALNVFMKQQENFALISFSSKKHWCVFSSVHGDISSSVNEEVDIEGNVAGC